MKELKKVQQMGNALTIYLPRKWTEANGVDKGSTVFVTESTDGALSILAKRSGEKTTANVQADNAAEGLHHVTSSYVCGAGEIVVRGKRAFEVANSARNKLAAIELLNEPDGRFVLRMVAETSNLPQEETILRMFNSSRALYEYVLSVIEGKAEVSLEELETRDDTVDRRHLLLLRQAYQSRNAFEAVSNTRIALAIERVCDHLVDIGQYASSNRGTKHDVDALKDAFATFERAFRYYAKSEFDFSFFEQADSLTAKLRKQVASSNGNSEHSNYLRHCIRIVEYSTDLCEIACNRIRCSRIAASNAPLPKGSSGVWKPTKQKA